MPHRIEHLFEESEYHNDLNRVANREELLRMKGAVPMTRAAKMLGINPKGLRNFAKQEQQSGVNVYDHYGLAGDSERWQLHMPTFRAKLKFFKQRFGFASSQLMVEKIPNDITRQAFFNLRGIFKLSDVLSMELNEGKGFIPIYKHEVLQVAKELPRDICGVFKPDKFWYVDFAVFLPWVYALIKDVPLDEARALIHSLRD